MLFFFCGYFSPAFEKHSRSSVTFPQGQPLPHLPHPLNMGQRGMLRLFPLKHCWKVPRKLYPSREFRFRTWQHWQVTLLAPGCLLLLYATVAWLSSLSTPAIHTLRVYSTRGFSPYLGLYCRFERGNPNHSLQHTLCSYAAPGPAQIQTEVDKM